MPWDTKNVLDSARSQGAPSARRVFSALAWVTPGRKAARYARSSRSTWWPSRRGQRGSGKHQEEVCGAGRYAVGLVVSTDACTTDADCVPAGCCHAAACVGVASAPSCGDVMCTSECRYGTLDCGGGCLCHAGHCAARLSAPPAGVGDLPPPS